METKTKKSENTIPDNRCMAIYNGATPIIQRDILNVALSLMESDNSRGRIKCICMAVNKCYKDS
jgi:hypothetical protein